MDDKEVWDGPVPPPWDAEVTQPAQDASLSHEGRHQRPTLEQETRELLDDLATTLVAYVVFPNAHAVTATALWIATTHVLPAFQFAPRLAVNSPEKRCGKTRLLDVVAGLCWKPLATVNATTPAIFRSLGDESPPTLILDEADTIWGTKRQAENNEDLRALLNAGFERGRPALRCVGPNQVPTEFPTFSMVALAGIGDAIPDTVTDRSVNFTLRRRTNEETVSAFRARRDGPVLAALNKRLQEWGGRAVPQLTHAQPDMPVEDRAADTWEPLIAVADMAGPEWGRRAREACVALTRASSADDEEGNLSILLLSDIRNVFERTGTTFMPAQALISNLKVIEESPWGEWDFTPRKLALRLKPFGVRPNRNAAGTARGYRIKDLEDAFRRYLRQNPSDPSESPE